MGYAKYVGRVGALAVALGIGTAVANPAWADTTTESTTNTSSSSSPSESGPAAAGTGTASTQSSDAGDQDPTTDETSTDGDTAAEDAAAEDAAEETSVEDATVDEDAVVQDAVPTEDPAPEPVEPVGVEEPPIASGSPVGGTDDVPSDQDPTVGPKASGTDAVPANPVVEPVADEPISLSAATFAVDEGSSSPTVPAGLLTVTAVPQSVPTPAPAPLVRQPKTPLGVLLGTPGAIINIATKVVSMLLAPIFNPGPANPAEPPLIWAVLAFARREIQRTFFNTSPTAVADVASTSEGTPTTIAALANDTDPNSGDVLTVTQYTQAQNGTVVLHADGSFTYTPDVGFTGTDTFSYTISDEASAWHVHGLASQLRGRHLATAAVTITVGAAVNAAPVAGPDSATVSAGSGAATIDVLANDTDPDGDSLSVTDVTQPANGTTTFTALGVTYTPAQGFAGTDTFTYTVSDGVATTTGTVTVTVTPVAPVNQSPVTTADTYTMSAGATTATVDVVANDTDADGDTLTVVGVTGATNGVAGFSDGSVTYTPTPGYAGNETLTYTVSDGTATATGTLIITVPAVNHAPAIGQPAYQYTTHSGSGIISGTINAADEDGDALTYTVTGLPDSTVGTVAIDSATGTWQFKPTNQARLEAWRNPEGRDAVFTVAVSDGQASTLIEVVAPIDRAVSFTTDVFDVNERLNAQGLAIAPDGRVYITQYLADDQAGTVTVVNADGSIDTVIEIASVIPEAIVTAYDVAIGPDGRVFVSGEVGESWEADYEESFHGVVVVIDPASDYSVALFAELAAPASSLDIDSAGRVYVGSWTSNTITVLHADGSIADTIRLPEPTDATTGVAGVAVGPNGRIYVTNPWQGTLTVVEPDGSVAQNINLGGNPWAVTVGPNGALYVTDPDAGTITVLNPDGSTARTVSLGSESYPSDVTLGADGRVYAAYSVTSDEGAFSRIAVLTPVAVTDLLTAAEVGVPIPGTPGSLGGAVYSNPVVADDGTVYQTISSRDALGVTVVTVAMLSPLGATSFSDAVSGDPAGPLVIDADGTAYQTVSYRDTDTGATVTGVVILRQSGESWFTGYHTGDAAGAVVFGIDGTGYQTLSQRLVDGTYTTTVLVMSSGGTTAYTIDGFAGSSGIGAPSGPVVAPDGTLYLTVGHWVTDPATLQPGEHTTTVAILGPSGLVTYSIAGAAGGGVGFGSDGTVYQPIYRMPAGPDAPLGTAHVAVLNHDGLVPLPGAGAGIPIGSPVLGPDGKLYQTVFSPVFDTVAGTVEYVTAVAVVTQAGLSPILSGIAGIPLQSSGESGVLPVVVGPDGTAYQVTQNVDPATYTTSTTLAVLTAAGDTAVTDIAGEVVGTVVPGINGRAFLTTYDADTDTTRVAVITEGGTVIHTLAGRPGDPRSAEANMPVIVGPDGTAYQTTSTTDPDTGVFVTMVSVISQAGVATHSIEGFPAGSVAIGPDGAIYQSIGNNASGSAASSTTVVVVAPTGITPITHPITGAPAGPVVFGPGGIIYQATVETTPGAMDGSTRVYVIGESPMPASAQRDSEAADAIANLPAHVQVSPAVMAEATVTDTAGPAVAAQAAAMSATNTMSPVTGAVNPIATIPTSTVYPYPSQVVVSPDGRHVYTVTITGTGSTLQQAITIVDTRTNTVKTTPVSTGYPYNAYGIAVSPDGRHVYTNGLSFTGTGYQPAAFVLDTITNSVRTIPISSAYFNEVGIAVSPDGRRVYYSGVTLGGSQSRQQVLTVLDTTSYTVTTIAIPNENSSDPTYYASGVVVSPNGRYVYTTSVTANLVTTVNVLDTTGNTTTPISLGGVYGGFGLALSPDGRRAYTVGLDLGSGSTVLAVLDTVTKTVTTISSPNLGSSGFGYAVTVSPDGRRVYVNGEHGVMVFDTRANDVTVVPINYSDDSRTGGIAISRDGRRIYVTSGYTRSGTAGEEAVVVLDTSKINSVASQNFAAKAMEPLIPGINDYQQATKTPDYNLRYLLGEFDRDNKDIKSDTIWVDKIVGYDGNTRLVIFMGGVKSFQQDFHGFFGWAGSANAVIQAKLGIIDRNMDKYINQEVQKIKNNGGHAEIMLVGFSKGGMAAQNYAATGKYKHDVSTVITFGSPLVKKASEYQSNQNVLHLEAKNDYVPLDGGDAGTITFVRVNGTVQYKVSTNGVRETFDNDPTDSKTVYIVDTGGKDGEGHNKATYLQAAKVYDDNAWRWSQSRDIIDAIDRFFDGTMTHIDMDPRSPGTGRSF